MNTSEGLPENSKGVTSNCIGLIEREGDDEEQCQRVLFQGDMVDRNEMANFEGKTRVSDVFKGARVDEVDTCSPRCCLDGSIVVKSEAMFLEKFDGFVRESLNR